jgi:hypothetical protein
MAHCFACVGDGQATPAGPAPALCPRCKGSGCEPGSGRAYRVDVASVTDPDRPFHLAYFEAADLDAAIAVARGIVVAQASNPDLHYGELYAMPADATQGARWLSTIDPAAGVGPGVRS